MIATVSFDNTDWILFSKTILVKMWSTAVVLVLVTLVGLRIRGRNPF